MNFIFGLIVLAMAIIAMRVIWATLWQILAVLKSASQLIKLKMAQRSLRASVPVVLPCLPHPVDWELMADGVRVEIQRRNTGVGREVDRLEAQLQAKLKTLELIKADIQIAKLEQELQKVKPAVMLPASDSGKKRKRTKASEPVIPAASTAIVPPQVQQLRAALKGGNGCLNQSNGLVRH